MTKGRWGKHRPKISVLQKHARLSFGPCLSDKAEKAIPE